MTDAAPEPEGSGEEIKRKFREALERKRAKHADANAARGGKDAGKVHGARGLARSRRSFRRKTAADRLTERTVQRADDHQMSATARRSPSPSPSDHLSAIRGRSTVTRRVSSGA